MNTHFNICYLNGRRLRGAAFLLASASFPLLVASASAQEKRSLDAHEHGTAIMNLAQEGSTVQVELESPAMNIVGFEHAPKDDADQKAIDDAIVMLEDGAMVMSFPEAAACTLAKAEAGLIRDEHEEHGDDDHHDDHEKEGDDHHDDHDKEEGHEHKDEHKDDHDDHADHDEDEEGGHSEFRVSYTYTCEAPDQLTSVSISAFDQFAGLESLQLNAVTAGGQSATTLTPAANEAQF